MLCGYLGFFNLISCGRKPGWLCLCPDLCWDRLDDGLGTYRAAEEGDSRSAPPMKESLRTARGDRFNSSFSFYLFTCIYWWSHLQKVASVTSIIGVVRVPYCFNFTSMKKVTALISMDFYGISTNSIYATVPQWRFFSSFLITFKIARYNEI